VFVFVSEVLCLFVEFDFLFSWSGLDGIGVSLFDEFMEDEGLDVLDV